jgi:hypothetical protein
LPFPFSLFLCLCVTLSKSVFQSFLSFNETFCSSLLVFGSCCLSSLLNYSVSWLSSAFTAFIAMSILQKNLCQCMSETQ